MNIETLIVGPIEVNCYCVSCEKTGQTVIIDPGGNAEDILHHIQNYSVSVNTILLTHGHFDHIGAVEQIKRETGARVMLHKDDKILIDMAERQAEFLGLPAPEPFSIDHYINDGDVISVGQLEAHVIATPGHSAGSVCYQFNHILFAGDTLFRGGIGRTDFPGGDYNQILHSIKNKLFVLDEETKVYPGHGPTTTIGWEKKHNPFLL